MKGGVDLGFCGGISIGEFNDVIKSIDELALNRSDGIIINLRMVFSQISEYILKI